jgi:uncharacterized metal-binding protein YceD (DUF177 family)
MKSEMPHPEFSRPFPVERLGTTRVTETIEAKPQERAALAKRFDLVSLDSLSAVVSLDPVQAIDLIRVTGQIEADVVQTCVVTLEPFATHVSEPFALDFSRNPVEEPDGIDLDMDAEPPEPVEDGAIDIGELAAQYLSLALDPYPRSPGATLPPDADGEGSPLSPFAVLATLKPKN